MDTLATQMRSIAPELFRCDGAIRPRGIAQTLGLAASVDGAKRDELLKRAVERKYVELEVDLLAYEQRRGEQNRNFIRFSESAIVPMAASGANTPFLRDHQQQNTLARSGTIVRSAGTVARDGHAEIRQSVKLTEPSAVERALRNLLDGVSIGWHPTGPILCTVCRAPIFEKAECRDAMHLPGDDVDGAIVEFEFTAAELIETSEVAIPDVVSARAEEIRAQVATMLGVQRLSSRPIAKPAPKSAPSSPSRFDGFSACINPATGAPYPPGSILGGPAPRAASPASDADMWRRIRG
jgi:hypothetical protein